MDGRIYLITNNRRRAICLSKRGLVCPRRQTERMKRNRFCRCRSYPHHASNDRGQRSSTPPAGNICRSVHNFRAIFSDNAKLPAWNDPARVVHPRVSREPAWRQHHLPSLFTVADCCCVTCAGSFAFAASLLTIPSFSSSHDTPDLSDSSGCITLFRPSASASPNRRPIAAALFSSSAVDLTGVSKSLNQPHKACTLSPIH